MASYIFDPSKGESAATLARQREIAEALLSQSIGTPRTIGDGIAALGKGLSGYLAGMAVAKKQAAGDNGADAAWNNVSAAMSPGAFPAAPGQPTVSDYADTRVKTASGDSASSIKQGLVDRGMSPGIADAFVMNFQDESGLNPGINEKNPTVAGSRGGYGLAQWTGPRRRALESFAASQGKPAGDQDTQLDFLMSELGGPEAQAWKSIQAAPDTGHAAAAIVNQFLRPRDDLRAARERQYLGSGPAPVQVASNDPSIGLPAQAPILQPNTGAPPPVTMAQPAGDGMPPVAGDPAASTAAGQRFLSTMTNPEPIAGRGAVVQALAAQQPPPPQQASPAVQQVAQAMPGDANIPVMAGGSSGAISRNAQGGPDMGMLMGAMGNGFMSPERQRVLGALLQQQMQAQEQANDPLRQLQIKAAEKSLAVPPKQWQKLDDHTLFDPASGETKTIGDSGAGDIFDGKSVEGQSLNWLIKNGKLTPEQAAQLGAGKTITGPNGEIIFMTPQGVFGKAAGGGQAQPITPAPAPQASPAQSVPPAAAPIGAPVGPVPAAPVGTPEQPTDARPGMIPLTDPKSLNKPPNEAQQRNQQLYTVVKPEVDRINQTFGAMSDPNNQLWSNLPVGADYATTQEYQQAANSLRTVVASYLYSVSGATATPGEVEQLSSTLIPRVGEKKGSIDDKLARIHTMVDAIKNNRGIADDEPTAAKSKTSTGVEWSIEQ
ncbi:hypothetical protein FJ872_31970 [Mesorhizobium sp. B2-5-9]|uniref:phage tail tip lysozyme n=1 Tax=Mesorhizobium sp. B2-5-9 TaxID=2589921 RepID=UPI0011298F95|nr:phage tail tip lysozyme [Mesorhizobium sp. B2-5-9]TPJ97632.1 hypothetical protein FJ872_31970 [Mesorhizobium sp. B2-5-9]